MFDHFVLFALYMLTFAGFASAFLLVMYAAFVAWVLFTSSGKEFASCLAAELRASSRGEIVTSADIIQATARPLASGHASSTTVHKED